MEVIFNTNYSTTAALCGTLAALTLTYVALKWMKSLWHFKKLNIPGPTPYPLVGNMYGLMKHGVCAHDVEIMKKYGNICGYFETDTPNILTTDVELLRHVLLKDFHCFVNRRSFDGLQEEPFDKFLTSLKDAEWKNVRSIITTTFTASKLKLMLGSMKTCADNILKYVEKIEKEGKLWNTKDAYGCYTLDVIASCCFGVCTDATNDPDCLFIKYLKQMFSTNFTRSPKIILLIFLPKLARYLSQNKMITFFPREPIDFFKQVTEEVLQKRRSKQEVRNDFIQIMVDHEEKMVSGETEHKDEERDAGDREEWKHLKKTLTDGEILAQALLFMFGGYETTASALNFTTYHLATNPDVQQRLHEEIKEALQEHGELNYDLLMNNLPYMDMVINETLRLYPSTARLDRVCSQEFKYKEVTIPRGAVVTVPICALHRDPSLYPDPEKFIPERFAENKPRDNVAFLAFGAGPRNCIGQRFAILEMKTILTELVLNYEFLATEHTPVPLRIESTNSLKPSEPILVKMKKRFLIQ